MGCDTGTTILFDFIIIIYRSTYLYHNPLILNSVPVNVNGYRVFFSSTIPKIFLKKLIRRQNFQTNEQIFSMYNKEIQFIYMNFCNF